MKNNDIFRAIGGIDDDLVERAVPTDTAVRTRSSTWLKWLAPVAACLVIAVIAIVALPSLLNNSGDPGPAAGMGGGNPETPSGAIQEDVEGCYPARLDIIFGLPASDYTWDEGDGVMSDRMVITELRTLMREFDSSNPNMKMSFAVVSAVSSERFSDEGGRGQITDCGVLFDVLGAGIVEPLKVKQYLYGGCVGDEQTNLLRIGGVYVLPLVTWQGEDYWRIYGDLDVLFEVDDKRLIQSHSIYEGLNKYNGVKLEELWKDIVYLYDNPLLSSRFAEYIADGFEIESAAATIALVHPDIGWDESDAEGFSAKIGGDGRITIATAGFNVFRAVEGMTTEEMHHAISAIRQYVGLEEPSTPKPVPTTTPVDGSDGTPAAAVTTPEDARVLLVEEYARQGFGEVTAHFEAVTTLWGTVDVYLFSVSFDSSDGSEYGAIVISNGAFMRLEQLPDGDFSAYSGVLPVEQ